MQSVIDAIGHTPLILMKQASALTGCTILGKAEFLNPGGSIKDRAALAMVQDAAGRGALRPGGTIVEGTAGNTGIGLALVAGALGYRTVIVIPKTQSQEKKDMLRMSGAELVEVPALPYSDPGNYVHVSQRLAARLDQQDPQGAFWANQFDNTANRAGHEATTGPEIWEETGARSTDSSVRSGLAELSRASEWRSRPAIRLSRSALQIRWGRLFSPITTMAS